MDVVDKLFAAFLATAVVMLWFFLGVAAYAIFMHGLPL